MKINQLKLVMHYVPNQIGFILRSKEPGLGVIEEMKKIASEDWKQEFILVRTSQVDMYNIEMLIYNCKHYSKGPKTIFFDEMEKITNEMREYILKNFSINRNEILHNDTHVIYHELVNEDEVYQTSWDDYVISHGVTYSIEK